MIDMNNDQWSVLDKAQFDMALWMEMAYVSPAYDEDDAADNQPREERDLYAMTDEEFDAKVHKGLEGAK